MELSILIVEDVFLESDYLNLILIKAGHRVTGVAKTVDQALNCLKKETPDVVLLDIFLKGDKTGINLADMLAKMGIPFIYLSANSNPATLEAAKQTNPYGFLVKPYREKDILIALDIAAHRHQHFRDQVRRQEKWFSSLMGGIVKEASSREQRSLQLAKGLQQCIPFDHIMIYTGCEKGDFSDLQIYKRADFGDFLRLDTTILIQKAQWQFEDLRRFYQDQSGRDEIQLRDQAAFANACLRDRVLAGMRRYLKAQSSLSVSLPHSDDHRAILLFLSCAPEGFDANHIAFLRPMRSLLGTILGDDGKVPEDTVETTRTTEDAHRQFDARLLGLIGQSTKLQGVIQLAMQVATVNSTALIMGETGVGKELVAKAIHQFSPRKDKPMIKLNCSAIPPSLIESELFGHERGAFTSAIERRIGKFEQADGGTIFLDEIGEMPIGAQAKLLRVLQEREFERVGGSVTKKVDVRVIAATNRDLYEEVNQGKFRMDLYYRLLVFPIHVPPLRERKEDIPLLADHFIRAFAASARRPVKTLSDGAIDQLMSHSWPGNIRELQNLLEREMVSGLSAVIESVGLPRPIDLPAKEEAELATDVTGLTDKEMIIAALKKCNGKVSGKSGAAEALGLNANTLSSRMRRLGISWKYVLE